MQSKRLKECLESYELLDHHANMSFEAGTGPTRYLHNSAGHHTEVVSLDISKAFNRIWTLFVLEQVLQCGRSGHMVNFNEGFLTLGDIH